MKTQQIKYTQFTHMIYFILKSLIKCQWLLFFRRFLFFQFLLFFHGQLFQLILISIRCTFNRLPFTHRIPSDFQQELGLMFIKIKKQNREEINILLITLIMKKYERVNLTSQIYKQKTPTKSSLNIKPVQTSQHNSFTKSYHNVCCPNCRYLFKIPKENQRPKTPTNTSKIQGINKGTGQKNQRTIEVQTQQYLLGNFRTSPKRQKIREENSKRGQMTDRTPQRSPYFQQIKNTNKSPLFTDRNQTSNRQLMTSRKKQISSISNQKISNLIKQKNTTKQKFPARSAYMKSNAETSKIKQQKSTNSLNKQIEVSAKKKTNAGVNLEQINNNLVGELMKQIQLSEEINEIIKYQMNLPPQLSVPSYCKMLVYEMEDKRQALKPKEKALNGRQNRQESIYEEEVSGDAKVDREIKRMLNY